MQININNGFFKLCRKLGKRIGNENGFLGGLLGGLASGALSYFGSKKNAPTNIESILERYKTPQETESGGYTLPILKERAAGKGVAFTPEQLTMYGQPYAQAAQNQWKAYGKPAVEEAYSARGLGRSTMAGQGITQGELDLADKIGLNWTELNKWNEILKQSGIEGGVSQLMNYMGSELSQANKNTAQTNRARIGDVQAMDAYNDYDSGRIWNAVGSGLSSMGGLSGGGNALSSLLGNLGNTSTGTGVSKISADSLSPSTQNWWYRNRSVYQ